MTHAEKEALIERARGGSWPSDDELKALVDHYYECDEGTCPGIRRILELNALQLAQLGEQLYATPVHELGFEDDTYMVWGVLFLQFNGIG